MLFWVLITQILRAAHDELGHNGTLQSYMLVCRLYYCKSLKTSVNKCIKENITCQKRNVQVVKCAQLHFSTPKLPMQFISLDLIGPFDPSSYRHHYTLSVICMLRRYVFCVPLKTKAASDVVQACIDKVYAKCGDP